MGEQYIAATKQNMSTTPVTGVTVDMHDPIQERAVSHPRLWCLRPDVHGDVVDISSDLDLRVHQGTLQGFKEGSIRGGTPDCSSDDILPGGPAVLLGPLPIVPLEGDMGLRQETLFTTGPFRKRFVTGVNQVVVRVAEMMFPQTCSLQLLCLFCNHWQCKLIGSPRLSNPSTAATALSPITCTQAAIGNQAFLTVSCKADKGNSTHNRRNSALTGRISEMLSGFRHRGRGKGFDRDKKVVSGSRHNQEEFCFDRPHQ